MFVICVFHLETGMHGEKDRKPVSRVAHRPMVPIKLVKIEPEPESEDEGENKDVDVESGKNSLCCLETTKSLKKLLI